MVPTPHVLTQVSSMSKSLVRVLLPVCFLLITVPAQAGDPLDWPNWRGPQQNGTYPGTGLADEWDPEDGTNVVWKSPELAGRSTPIVMNGRLYTIVRSDPGTPQEGEKVVCVDAATGKLIWESKFNVYLSDVPDTRVGWSCCVGDPETGNVYALGVCGYFQCIDPDGKTLWSHSLHEEYGLLSTYGGRTNVPVLFEDLIIVSAVVIGWGDMAKPAHRFLAFNKKTGELVWFNGTRLLPYDTTYSTPTVAVIGGQQSLVFGSGDGSVWALQPRTGKRIWKHQLSVRGLNVSPLVLGDRVFTGHSEENILGNTMGTFIGIDALASGKTTVSGEKDITGSGTLWRHDIVRVGKSSPVPVEDYVVAVDDGARLRAFNTETGDIEVEENLGKVMRGSPLYADGKIYLCTRNGIWCTLSVEDGEIEVLQKFRLPDGEECHGSVIAAQGRLYLPTTDCLYCIADTSKEAGMEPVKALPKEEPLPANPKVDHVQVVPAEVLLKPGKTQKFAVRLFDSQGRFIKESPAKFTLEGPGSIDSDGIFTAPDSKDHTATIVTAQVGDVDGTARVRVVPDLPWSFDFKDGKVPITWVGARYRHQTREMDGDQLMVKVSTIPKGARSRAWMGDPATSNYTMQADVRGSNNDGKMPDIGLIAQRYTLDLMGAHQQLQIRTWGPVMRMAKKVKFSWQPDTWYTMKFRAEIEQDAGEPVAVLRGKVWPRGTEEPEQWTIQAVDKSPNLNGSPGLYGNAKDAELYLDNITVTPND